MLFISVLFLLNRLVMASIPVSKRYPVDYLTANCVGLSRRRLESCFPPPRFGQPEKYHIPLLAIDNDYSIWKDKHRQQLYNTKAEVFVFYCNNASSNSPREVQAYNRWLRKNHPESKQRYLMLESGINGLHYYMKENRYSDEDMSKVFRSYNPTTK
jgi:hypothetical protein